jgi:HSP20 family protein
MYVTRHSFFNMGSFHAGRPLQAGIQRAFDHLSPVQDNGNGVSASSARPWLPPVDIREDEGRFVILADIPGMDPQQIEVSMDKGVLRIKGSRERADGIVASDDKAGRFSRVERAHGAFDRCFALPESADADGITASGNHGVLEISIPKKALPTPRRITINGGH